MDYSTTLSTDNITIDDSGVNYTEEWRDIIGFEGLYKVSSLGRVKSLVRKVGSRFGINRTVRERVLKQKLNRYGYKEVSLCCGGNSFVKTIHRLVGIAFIPNPENKPEINHTEMIKIDNRFWKLEWATNKENIAHSYTNLPNKDRKLNPHMIGKKGALHHNSKKVHCPTLDIYFGSAAEAERELGLYLSTVYKVCSGEQLHAQGLVFRYV